MVNLGDLNWFDSSIKKLKKSIGLYQPCDLYPWLELFVKYEINEAIIKMCECSKLYQLYN